MGRGVRVGVGEIVGINVIVAVGVTVAVYARVAARLGVPGSWITPLAGIGLNIPGWKVRHPR